MFAVFIKSEGNLYQLDIPVEFDTIDLGNKFLKNYLDVICKRVDAESIFFIVGFNVRSHTCKTVDYLSIKIIDKFFIKKSSFHLLEKELLEPIYYVKNADDLIKTKIALNL